MDDIIRKITQEIIKKYQDLDNPKYFFVSEATSKNDYHILKDKLKKLFKLKDYTDFNESVCYHYLLESKEIKVNLFLSIIGPYALILDENKKKDEKVISINNKETCYDPLLNILLSEGIEVLTSEVLEYPIAINLFNTSKEDSIIYQAIFVDSEKPW